MQNKKSKTDIDTPLKIFLCLPFEKLKSPLSHKLKGYPQPLLMNYNNSKVQPCHDQYTELNEKVNLKQIHPDPCWYKKHRKTRIPLSRERGVHKTNFLTIEYFYVLNEKQPKKIRHQNYFKRARLILSQPRQIHVPFISIIEATIIPLAKTEVTCL